MCAIPINISAYKKIGGRLSQRFNVAGRPATTEARLLLGFFVRFLRYEEGENGKL